MGLETGAYINSLVATNPVGATDPKSQGDDHLRLIKATILATFAAITGAVTATHTELNYMAGATGVTGTGNTVRSASPTFTGTLTAATVAATTITGAGSGLTALNASNLASGTVPDARFPATLPAASAANLTAIPAANITGSHTLPDGVLSTNVPLLNAANVFTASNFTVKFSSAIPMLFFNETDGPSDEKNWQFYADSGDLTFRTVNDAVNSVTNFLAVSRTGTTVDQIALAATTLSLTGLVTTPNASAAEVGYKGVPITAKTADYTIAAADAGTCLSCSSAADDITVQASGAPPDGTIVMVVNATAGAIHIRQGSGATLYLQGTATTGDRTVAQSGVAFIYFHSISAVLVSGSGVS